MSLVIIGAGPNLGLAVARRFGREGITAAGAAADIRDAEALAAAIDALAGRLGEVEVLGEVAYARMLHDELADQGIHVAHTAIGGRIAPGGDHEPADVAELLWSHHAEHGPFQTRIGIPS